MNNFKEKYEEIVNCLINGGVVLLPTDTVYGLAALPTQPKAVSGIYDLKSRPKGQKLPIMVSTKKQLIEMSLDLNFNVTRLLDSQLVPGDISIVLGFISNPILPWLSERDEVAIRIPNHSLLLKVLDEVGPLLVTSANKHGSPVTPNNVKDVLSELNGTPDLVVDGGIIENIPSTIINCRLNPPVIERLGRLSNDEIFKILE